MIWVPSFSEDQLELFFVKGEVILWHLVIWHLARGILLDGGEDGRDNDK